MRGVFGRNIALSLGLLLSLSASTAFAQGRERLHCRASAADVILQVIRATPDVHVYEFRGEDAKIGIALYNSLPPQGHLQGDRFYILIKPGAPISHLMIGDSDCLRDTATVDRHTAGVIKQVIERTAAQSSI
jgi:hypothetical protein